MGAELNNELYNLNGRLRGLVNNEKVCLKMKLLDYELYIYFRSGIVWAFVLLHEFLYGTVFKIRRNNVRKKQQLGLKTKRYT